MFYISKRSSDKKSTYEIQRINHSEWNGDQITKFGIASKEKDGSFTNATVIVWGANIQASARNRDNEQKGDKIALFGISKLGMGREYKGRRDVEIYCDESQIQIIPENPIPEELPELDDLPDPDEDLPF